MENTMNFESVEKMGFIYPKELKTMSFQNIFTFIRKSLQIKYTRRIHIDSMLKKCKGKFFKAVHDCLVQCVKISLRKLPQNYITNISIEYNKQFLGCTICNLYSYFNSTPYSMETILKKNYCINGKESFFIYIFNSKVSDLYLSYLQSKRFKREINFMEKKRGLKVALLYQFIAQNFLNYYYFSKPHIKKIKEQENNITKSNNKISFVDKKENDNNITKDNKVLLMSKNENGNNISKDNKVLLMSTNEIGNNIQKDKKEESKEMKKYYFQIEK